MKISRTNWEQHKKGGVTFISLPKKELDDILERMVERSDELDDLASVRLWKENKEETIPAEIVFACMDAANNGERVARIRKFRKLTRDQLAKRVGVTGASISIIETGKRKGTVVSYTKIANSLSVPLEMLVGE